MIKFAQGANILEAASGLPPREVTDELAELDLLLDASEGAEAAGHVPHATTAGQRFMKSVLEVAQRRTAQPWCSLAQQLAPAMGTESVVQLLPETAHAVHHLVDTARSSCRSL